MERTLSGLAVTKQSTQTNRSADTTKRDTEEKKADLTAFARM